MTDGARGAPLARPAAASAAIARGGRAIPPRTSNPTPTAVHEVAATPVQPSPVSTSPPASPCAAAIAAVEGRGLFPAAGFVVICPGFALGHEGMTCMNVAGVCPGASEIVIHDPEAFVVANEFENSRIFTRSPVRCDAIDCGGAAYGY